MNTTAAPDVIIRHIVITLSVPLEKSKVSQVESRLLGPRLRTEIEASMNALWYSEVTDTWSEEW